MDTKMDGAVSWHDALYDLLRRNNVSQFADVPDAGHRMLIDRALADPPASERNMDPSACRYRFRAALLGNN